MAPDVIQRHIDLYVNDYTLHLDAAAVQRLMDFDRTETSDTSGDPLFAYR
jgi:predicted solute-binding protein